MLYLALFTEENGRKMIGVYEANNKNEAHKKAMLEASACENEEELVQYPWLKYDGYIDIQQINSGPLEIFPGSKED